jgi:RNA polymerase sigma-70 factor, ECF subfamily
VMTVGTLERTDSTAPDRPVAARADFEAEALRWLPELSRFAMSLTREQADADDLVQDTYLAAYRNWHQFTPGSECRAWLFTICRHLFYRSRRRASRREELEDASAELDAADDPGIATHADGLVDVFQRSEIASAVDAAIADLPPVFRDVVVLVDVNDRSYEEASRVLGVPVGTIRSRLFRARRILQTRLLDHARDLGLIPRQRILAGASRTHRDSEVATA